MKIKSLRFISNDSEILFFKNNNEQFYQIFCHPALQTFALREKLKYALVLNFDYKIFLRKTFIDSRKVFNI